MNEVPIVFVNDVTVTCWNLGQPLPFLLKTAIVLHDYEWILRECQQSWALGMRQHKQTLQSRWRVYIYSGFPSASVMNDDVHVLIKDEVLLTVSCPIFPFILIAKNLFTGSLKNRSIDNLETQKKSISMKNSQFFDYLHYAKPK